MDFYIFAKNTVDASLWIKQTNKQNEKQCHLSTVVRDSG